MFHSHFLSQAFNTKICHILGSHLVLRSQYSRTGNRARVKRNKQLFNLSFLDFISFIFPLWNYISKEGDLEKHT